MNNLIRTSAIGLLQHLQLLYLPSELDIHKQNTTSYLTLYCMQYHPVIPTDPVEKYKPDSGFSTKKRLQTLC
jgi:hypothetical protein